MTPSSEVKQPLISVVMSNYNGEKYLAAAVDSIISQTYENFEVILVDDGSSDGSVASLRSFTATQPKIRLIELPENRGQANGFNIGIKEAQGALVAFMDSDDLWYPDKLEKLANYYLQNPSAVLLQHNLYIRRGDTPTRTCFRKVLLSGNLLEQMKCSDQIPDFSPTTGLAFPKSVLEKIGPIPLEFKTCADGYLTRTAMCFGPVCSTTESWGEYRVHESNATLGNPGFSAKRYIESLLYPKLQQFYIDHRIDFDFFQYRQRKRDETLQTYVTTTRLGAIFLISVFRSALFQLCRMPVLSSLFSLLPFVAKEQLNIERIVQLKGKHDSERAFIIGMGPSLKVDDLNKLKNEITFACNKIYLCFDETEWRPTYYSVMDILVAQNNRKEIQSLRLTKIFTKGVRDVFGSDKDIIWISELPPLIDQSGERYFKVSEDVRYGVYGGFTVLFFQIQLALYMGIREIYLLGLDFSFDLGAPSGEDSKHGKVLVNQGEVNHFHKDYRKKGETWTMPQLDMQRMAFQAASDYAKANGIRIFNASRETQLDVFERVDLDEVLN